jgi:hypothetical protein
LPSIASTLMDLPARLGDQREVPLRLIAMPEGYWPTSTAADRPRQAGLKIDQMNFGVCGLPSRP